MNTNTSRRKDAVLILGYFKFVFNNFEIFLYNSNKYDQQCL